MKVSSKNKSPVNIKKRIGLLVGSLVLSQLGLALVAINKSRALLGKIEGLTGIELPVTRGLTLADMYHDGTRAIVLESLYDFETGNSKDIASVEAEAQKMKGSMKAAFEKIIGAHILPERKLEVVSASHEIEKYSDSALEVIAAAKAGNRELMVEKKKVFDERFSAMEALLEKLGETLESDAHVSGSQGMDIVNTVLYFSLLGLLISMGVGTTVYLWIAKSFTVNIHQLRGGTERIFGLINLLTAESTKVKDTSVEQAAAIQESVSAVAEMSSMIAQTGQNVKLSLEGSQRTHEKTREGEIVMRRLKNSMDSILQASEQLNHIAQVISNIDAKTAIINDIVFKTQLLSFNASIEAARAGQHGRGFAVVAEEVGNLAELSGTAARDIESLLRESDLKVKETLELIITRINDGNRVSDGALSAFQDISKKIGEMNLQIKSIAEAAQQQELGIQQANSALKQMDAAAQQNSVSATQASLTSEKLRSESSALQFVIAQLYRLISGRKSPSGDDSEENGSDLDPTATQVRSDGPMSDLSNLVPNKLKGSDEELANLARRIASKEPTPAYPDSSGGTINADHDDFKRAA